MRFLRRSLLGLFLTSLAIGLLAIAASIVLSALQSRWAEEEITRAPRERVFTAEVVTVQPQSVDPILTAFGDVRSRRTLELRAPAQGTIIELADAFEDGGEVQAGQLLLRIDPAEAQSSRDVAATDLREGEADVREADRALSLALEDVVGAQVQADLQVRALARQRDLFDRGLGSAAAVETAELNVASSNQSVLSKRQSLAQAEAAVDQATTALERGQIALLEAERLLQETELHAEFSGVLSEVSIVAGRLVNRNEQVARLFDPDALEVSFRVSTTQHSRLLDDQGLLPSLPVEVLLDVLGVDLTVPGVLTRESGSVEAGQSGRLLFARLDETRGFRNGDFVTVRLQESPLSDVIVLPSTALNADNQVLVLADEDRLEEIVVTLLRRQGDDVIVRNPQLFGREVVVARTPVLGAGIKVNPLRASDAETDEVVAETVTLDPERRARLIAYVESNTFIPSDVKERMLQQLGEDEVPTRMVSRLEARMGS
jgi:multidrug efflux pump subunit AcrA (membrane-fusion protein)